MTSEQARRLEDIAQRERNRLTSIVDEAFTAGEGDPTKLKPLLVEFMTTQAMMVHLFAHMSASLSQIAAELVKANQPSGLMESKPQAE